MRIVFDTRDIGMISLVSNDAVYEPDVWMALSLLLKPGATFIDVGANVGIHTARALALVQRSGKVLAFEPNAQLFPMLRENIVLNGGSSVAQARQVAVYDRPGRMTFSYEANQHRVGALVLDGAVNYGESVSEVEVVTLDDFIDSIPDSAPTLIKIDVEGREEGVIRGAGRLLAERQDIALIMEFHQGVMTSVGTDVRQLMDRLGDAGLHPYRISATGFVALSFDEVIEIETHINLVLSRHDLSALRREEPAATMAAAPPAAPAASAAPAAPAPTTTHPRKASGPLARLRRWAGLGRRRQ